MPTAPTTKDEWIAHLNREYAVMLTGGKTLVLREIRQNGRPNDLEFLSLDAFRAWLSPYVYWTGSPPDRKAYKVANTWLQSPEQRRYDGLTFDPDPSPDDHRYNTWRGWGVEVDAGGDCTLFLTHLHDVICQGHEPDYAWLVTWLASIVQHPKQKDGTAVLIRGPQGVGKTMVGQIAGRLCGAHYLMADDPRMLTGRFNAHLAQTLLFQLEEAVWGGDHTTAGRLKGLITSPTLPVEYKGREVVDMPNYTRVLLTSNAHWAIPAALDDRRFAVFDTADAHRNDRPYFAAMLAQLEDGGYEHLLWFLAEWTIDPQRIVTPPRTSGLFEQAVESLDPLSQWWVDLLNRGELPPAIEGPGTCEIQKLYADYLQTLKTRGNLRGVSQTSFGITMRKLCPGIRVSRAKSGDVRPNLYSVPPLAECRRRINADWKGLTLWQNDTDTWHHASVIPQKHTPDSATDWYK